MDLRRAGGRLAGTGRYRWRPRSGYAPACRYAAATSGSHSAATSAIATRAGAAPRRRCGNGAAPGIRVLGIESGDHALHGQCLVHRCGQTPKSCRSSGRPAPCRARRRSPRSASVRRCCRTPPARGPIRRCRCPARTARSRRRPRRPSPTTNRRAPAPVEHVARNAVRAARADQTGGELIEIGLADQHRARRPAGAAPPAHRVAGIGETRAGRGRRHPGDVDVVLHRERHAPQRAAARPLRLQSARRRARTASSGRRIIQIAGSAWARSAAMRRLRHLHRRQAATRAWSACSREARCRRISLNSGMTRRGAAPR